MPPKKRRTVDLDEGPEPKRHVTRSASRAVNDAAGKNANAKSSIPAAKPAVTSKKTREAARANGGTPTKAKDTIDHVASSKFTAATTLTIEHESSKKPITCNHYAPSSKSTSTAATLIFTHGAGGTLSAPAVVNFCTGYSSRSTTFTFQGSMNLAARVKGFHACISHLGLENGDLTLGGRSMGARAAVIAGTEALSNSDKQCALSLVLVSYPLRGPKNDIRDKILLDLPASARVLFIIGEKDAMCPLDLLKQTRTKMAAGSRLVVVRGADHGMHVRPAAEEKRVGEETGSLAAAWADGEEGEKDIYIGGKEEG